MPKRVRLAALAFLAALGSTVTGVTARAGPGHRHLAEDPSGHTFQCGNTHVGPERLAEIEAPIQQAIAQRQAQRVGSTSARLSAQDDAELINIPVYWHIIYQAQDAADGYVSDSAITAQMGVLNSVYNAVGFGFSLAGVDRTLNADWFQNLQSQTQEEADMTTALHKGNASVLNIYTARFAALTGGSTLLGYSYNPWDVVDFPTYDAVYLNDRTMPGGSAVSSQYTFNLGIVGVHEVGHWLGLYHTFNGNDCDGPGDMVQDTHPEASSAFFCAPRSTCPSIPGTDPIRNYMDYTDDVCRNGFSAGQQQRMLDIWPLYRAPNAVPPAGTPSFFTGVAPESAPAPVPVPSSSSPAPTATATAPTASAPAQGRAVPVPAAQPGPAKTTAPAPSSGNASSKSSSQAGKPKPHAAPHPKPHAKPHAKPHVKPHAKPHPKPHRRPTAKPADKKKAPVHTIKSKAGLKRVIHLRHSVTTSAKAMLDAILPMN